MAAEPATLVGQEVFRPRWDLVGLVPLPARRILDIGCGPGLTGAALKSEGAEEVWGVERDPQLAAEARVHLDVVVCSDLEQPALLTLPEHYFDVILYGDVLEHLIDPWTVLREGRRFLRQRGRIVVSLPNAQHISVLGGLLRGEWKYVDDGILSIGHLRFFTTRSMRSLISGAGYQIERERANYGPRGRWLSQVTFGILDDFVAVQRVFVASEAP